MPEVCRVCSWLRPVRSRFGGNRQSVAPHPQVGGRIECFRFASAGTLYGFRQRVGFSRWAILDNAVDNNQSGNLYCDPLDRRAPVAVPRKYQRPAGIAGRPPEFPSYPTTSHRVASHLPVGNDGLGATKRVPLGESSIPTTNSHSLWHRSLPASGRGSSGEVVALVRGALVGRRFVLRQPMRRGAPSI